MRGATPTVWGTQPIPPVMGDSYAYQATRLGVSHAQIALTHAALKSGHVGVWLGASTADEAGAARSWIQAGVQQTQGQPQPHLYVEIGHQNGTTQYRSLGPYRYGSKVNVSLKNTNGVWTVLVNGRPNGQVYLGNNVHRVLTGESWHRGGMANKYDYIAQPNG